MATGVMAGNRKCIKLILKSDVGLTSQMDSTKKTLLVTYLLATAPDLPWEAGDGFQSLMRGRRALIPENDLLAYQRPDFAQGDSEGA